MTNANCLLKFKENIGLVNSSSEIIDIHIYFTYLFSMQSIQKAKKNKKPFVTLNRSLSSTLHTDKLK